MLALEAPQVSRRRRWHPQALLGRRGAVPRLNGVERSAMLLLTVGLHVAVLGVMLWQRPAPEASRRLQRLLLPTG